MTLWWALVGPGAARRRPRRQQGAVLRRPDTGRRSSGRPGLALSRLRAAAGRRRRHPAHFPMLTSRYRLPDAVQAIAPDRHGPRDATRSGPAISGSPRGRCPRIATPLSPGPDGDRPLHLFTPGYVMGAAIVPRLPAARWTRDQQPEPLERRGAGRTAPAPRVYATPAPQGGRIHLQCRARGAEPRDADRAAAAAPLQPRAPATWPSVSAPGFAAGRAGRVDLRRGQRLCRASAPPSAATRPIAARAESSGCLDQRSPVIIQAGTRKDHRASRPSRRPCSPRRCTSTRRRCSFQGLDGAGRLRFFLDSDRRPEVDGKPLEAPAGGCSTAPSCGRPLGSRTVEIAKGRSDPELRFD